MNIENAFIAITPYQIFNIINFVYNNVDGVKGNSDLYVYDNFRNSLAIVQKIKKEELFNNVYVYSKVVDIKPRILSKFRTLLYFIFPKFYFSKVFDSHSYGELIHKRYTNIYQCSDGLFMNAFHRLFQNTRNYLIEDGLYSYYGNMKQDRTSNDYKIVNKYLLRGTLEINAKRLYVNSSELCESTSAEKIVSLPHLSTQKELYRIFERIFNYQHNEWYLNKKFIYLTTPYENLKNVVWKQDNERNERYIIDILHSKKENYAIRVHPRQTVIDDYLVDEGTVDEFNNMWELECKEQIQDRQILISFFSTAVFTPKILYQKEPYIIFTYRILADDINGSFIVKELIKLYKNKNKIFVPKSIEEFQMIINSL